MPFYGYSYMLHVHTLYLQEEPHEWKASSSSKKGSTTLDEAPRKWRLKVHGGQGHTAVTHTYTVYTTCILCTAVQ